MSKAAAVPLTDYSRKVQEILSQPNVGGWPDFQGAQAEVFSEFEKWLKSSHNVSLWTDTYKLNSGYLSQFKNANPNPPDPHAQDAVLSVLSGIVGDVQNVSAFSVGMSGYLTKVSQNLNQTIQQETAIIALETKNPPKPPFPLGGLLDIFLAPLSLIPGGIGSAVASLVKGIVQVVDQDPSVPDNQKLNNDFVFATVNYESEITDRFRAYQNRVTDVFNAAMSDFNKLKALSFLFNDADVTWPQELTVAPEGDRLLRIGIWKYFLPLRWQLVTMKEVPTSSLEHRGVYPTLIGVWTPDPRAFFLNWNAMGVLDRNQYEREFLNNWPDAMMSIEVLFGISPPFARTEKFDPGLFGPGEEGDTEYTLMTTYSLGEWTGRVNGVTPRMGEDAASHLFKKLRVPQEEVFLQKNGWDFSHNHVNLTYSAPDSLDNVLGTPP